MKVLYKKTNQDGPSRAVANIPLNPAPHQRPKARFEDNRPEPIVQRRIIEMVNGSTQASETQTTQKMVSHPGGDPQRESKTIQLGKTIQGVFGDSTTQTEDKIDKKRDTYQDPNTPQTANEKINTTIQRAKYQIDGTLEGSSVEKEASQQGDIYDDFESGLIPDEAKIDLNKKGSGLLAAAGFGSLLSLWLSK